MFLVRVGISPSFSSKVTARLGESPCRLQKLNATTLEDEDRTPLPLKAVLGIRSRFNQIIILN